MIDVTKESDRNRLWSAITASRQALQPFRKTRKDLIRDYVGSHYAVNGADKEILVNLINQTANITKTALAFNNPKVKITVRDPNLQPFAAKYEMGLDKMIFDLQLNFTLQEIILDAFFCIGIAKVSMADSGEKLLDDELDVWYDPGKPWVDRVSPDDWVADMTVKGISKMRFSGDLYRVSYDKIKAEAGGMFDRKVVEKVAPTPKQKIDGEEGSKDIGSAADDNELEPMCWLMDLWLPESKQIATFQFDTGPQEPLAVRAWKGSKGGPYKYLGFSPTPDNIMPSSPASNLKGLCDLYNSICRASAEMAEGQKDVYLYPPGGESDAERVRTSPRLGFVKTNDPNSVKLVRFGGVDQGLMAFQLSLETLVDRMGGNVKAKAGLGAEAATVGQEKIIQGNVSREEAGMHFAVVNFAAEICGDLGFLMWHDGRMEIPGTREIGKTGIHIDQSWTPDHREGEFNSYDFQVEPYSMVYTTPEQKLQRLFSVLDKLAPMWPMLQSSGLTIDSQAVVDDIADLLDEPRVKRWLTFIQQQQGGELGGDENTIRQAPVTSRETIRKNVPTGGTNANRAMQMQQSLLSAAGSRQGGTMSKAG